MRVACEVDHVGGARMRAQRVERGVGADEGKGLRIEGGNHAGLGGGVRQPGRLAEDQRVPRGRRLPAQAAQCDARARRERQLVALREGTLAVVQRGKGQRAELGVRDDQHPAALLQRGCQRGPDQRVQPAHPRLRAFGQGCQVARHRRGAVAQRLDLEARRAHAFQHGRPARDDAAAGSLPNA